jgi:hypothetical protein
VEVGKGGVYHQVKVAGIVPVCEGEKLARSLCEAMSLGTPVVSPTDWRAHADPQLLKLAGVKSWGVLYRTASSWDISDHLGGYKIAGAMRRHGAPGWVDDPNQTVRLPPGTTAEEASARMVEMMQKAEARGKV